MPGLSDYAEQKVLNHIFRGTSWAALTSTYISLHGSDPTDLNNVASEIAATGGYARVAWACTIGNWTNPSPSGSTYIINNASQIVFPSPSGDWNGGTPISHVGIYDAASGGNLIASGILGTPRTVLAADNSPVFGPGALVISID
jgi:hypothetical protein